VSGSSANHSLTPTVIFKPSKAVTKTRCLLCPLFGGAPGLDAKSLGVKRLGAFAACLVVAAAMLPVGAGAVPGPGLWAQAGCGGCHTLAAAGSTGGVGPNLDLLRPAASRIALQIADGGAVMPSFNGSLSSSEIQALAAWIASVAGGSTGPSAASTANGTTGPSAGPGGALAGMSVAAVRQLQTQLARLGYFHHVVTGFYGPVTTAAVTAFERSAGLNPDGIWGPHVYSALHKRLAGR